MRSIICRRAVSCTCGLRVSENPSRRVIHILGASRALVAALLLLQLPQQALVSSRGHVSWLFSESKTMMAVRVRFIHRTRPRSPR